MAGVALMAAISLSLAACGPRTQRGVTTQSADGTLADTRDTAVGVTGSGSFTATVPNRAQQDVLDQLGMLGGKPLETLTPAEARRQPTPTDAVKALLEKSGQSTAPEAVASVINRTIPGPGGDIPVRVYTPAGAGPFPLVVYFQGGGFVIGSLDVYDASARALTNASRAIVVSVAYRKAPEHKFPAAHDDTYAAYAWVVANGRDLNGDVSRVALAGESAGGNLAMSTAIAARDRSLQMPVAVLAVYPIAGTNTNTESYNAHAAAKPLSRPLMRWSSIIT